MMKGRLWMLLALVLCLCMLQGVAWADINVADVPDERGFWDGGADVYGTSRYTPPAEKWARQWARDSYGPDMLIHGIGRIEEASIAVSVKNLFSDYDRLRIDTYEINLLPRELADGTLRLDDCTTVRIQVAYWEQDLGDYWSWHRFTLAGFLPPWEEIVDFEAMYAYSQQDAALADVFAAPDTATPDVAVAEDGAADVPDNMGYWYEGEYQDLAAWAREWARRQYGEDVVILALQHTEAPREMRIDALLNEYTLLKTVPYEMKLVPQSSVEDAAPSDGSITASIQVVYLAVKGEKYQEPKRYVLAGFLPEGEELHGLREAHAFLQQDPRFASSLAGLDTIMPDGVTEIDLRTVLGEDMGEVRAAWMLSADTGVVLLRSPEYKGFEIILFKAANRSILSRTRLSDAQGLYLNRWDRQDGVLHLKFTSRDDAWQEGMSLADNYPGYSDIWVDILPDGTVHVGERTPSDLTAMPGGETAIREAFNGSLYAVDLASGEEALLIQGVSERLGFEAEWEDAVAAYEPAWDEYIYDERDQKYIYYPFTEIDLVFSIREFIVMQPLDAHRFLYRVGTWEQWMGYGIYDLQTRTNHRITGRGNDFSVRGDALFGITLRTDINTYESTPLPEAVRVQLRQAADWMRADLVYQDISPDGRLLALSGMRARDDSASTVTVTDTHTGEVIRAYDIHNPFAREQMVSFYDDTRFSLFCEPEEGGAAFVYLFDVGA